ncbi:MAG: exopolyphosphatase [Pseudomonadota bacterium]
MTGYSTLAAVDLGSNSFRLQVARVVEDQLYPLDSLRDSVRLAAGLTADKYLELPTQQRALDCLRRFGERLRGFPPQAVRAVGTNTLRVAKNAAEFLKYAEAALGFPIEIIAGREEARLIYLGVAHGLPASRDKRLVMDIGGGSTEFIIGSGLKPSKLESLYMGCVSYSLRYFPGGKISKGNMKQAELAARTELQTIASEFCIGNWAQAYASSGTARAVADIIELNGMGSGGITPSGMARLRERLIKIGDTSRLALEGLSAERAPVFPGGFAILAAAFDELKLKQMTPASGALRQGVLYDMLGRFHQRDMRETTVAEFMRRYHVDAAQAKRVETLSLKLLGQLPEHTDGKDFKQLMSWAARLHEIGISVAHTSYHKHSAYIIKNADMPGFSRMEQARLSLLVLAHRGNLQKMREQPVARSDWGLVMPLRLAVLFCRSRNDVRLPALRLEASRASFRLTLSAQWLAQNPLTAAALHEESREWKSLGMELHVATPRATPRS